MKYIVNRDDGPSYQEEYKECVEGTHEYSHEDLYSRAVVTFLYTEADWGETKDSGLTNREMYEFLQDHSDIPFKLSDVTTALQWHGLMPRKPPLQAQVSSLAQCLSFGGIH